MMRVVIMGVRERETKAEMKTEPATTTPNSRKRRPVKPCRKMMGRKTTPSTKVVDTTAKKISAAPLWPASTGSMPCSILA